MKRVKNLNKSLKVLGIQIDSFTIIQSEFNFYLKYNALFVIFIYDKLCFTFLYIQKT